MHRAISLTPPSQLRKHPSIRRKLAVPAALSNFRQSFDEPLRMFSFELNAIFPAVRTTYSSLWRKKENPNGIQPSSPRL